MSYKLISTSPTIGDRVLLQLWALSVCLCIIQMCTFDVFTLVCMCECVALWDGIKCWYAVFREEPISMRDWGLWTLIAEHHFTSGAFFSSTPLRTMLKHCGAMGWSLDTTLWSESCGSHFKWAFFFKRSERMRTLPMDALMDSTCVSFYCMITSALWMSNFRNGKVK